MKTVNVYSIFIALLFVVSCKKDGNKNCPNISGSYTSGHLADLSPVSGTKQIMDTLAKYPQLQVTRAILNWGFDPGSYTAIIHCNILHQGLRIFGSQYSLWYSSYNQSAGQSRNIPATINISLEPSISEQRAKAIAEENVEFEHCEIARLGLSNKGTDSIPDFRLVWRVEGVETGYPVVELDAQNGNVYYKFDGVIWD